MSGALWNGGHYGSEAAVGGESGAWGRCHAYERLSSGGVDSADDGRVEWLVDGLYDEDGELLSRVVLLREKPVLVLRADDGSEARFTVTRQLADQLVLCWRIVRGRSVARLPCAVACCGCVRWTGAPCGCGCASFSACARCARMVAWCARCCCWGCLCAWSHRLCDGRGRAGARPPLFRCLSHVGCRGDWRARPCFLSLVSCGSCELLPPAARTLYGGAYESF